MEAKVQDTTMLEDFGVMTEEWTEEMPTLQIQRVNCLLQEIGKRPVERSDLEREQFRTNQTASGRFLMEGIQNGM